MAADRTFKILSSAMKSVSGNLAINSQTDGEILEHGTPLSMVPPVPSVKESDVLEHQVPLTCILDRLEPGNQQEELSSLVSPVSEVREELDRVCFSDQTDELSSPVGAESVVTGELDKVCDHDQSVEWRSRLAAATTLVSDLHRFRSEQQNLDCQIDGQDWIDEQPDPNSMRNVIRAPRQVSNYRALWGENRPGVNHRPETEHEKTVLREKLRPRNRQRIMDIFSPGLAVSAALVLGCLVLFAVDQKPTSERKPLAHLPERQVQSATSGHLQPVVSSARPTSMLEPARSGHLQPVVSSAKPTSMLEPEHAKRKLVCGYRNRNPLSEDQKESLREAKVLSQIDQLDPKLLKAKAYECMRQGDYNLAVLILARAIKANPNEPVARCYLAHCLVKVGDPANALLQYRTFEHLGAAGAADRMNFGTALAQAKDKEPAKAYFDQLIIESSDDLGRLRMLEQKCGELGLIQQASNTAFAVRRLILKEASVSKS